jgi:hypothetical protein
MIFYVIKIQNALKTYLKAKVYVLCIVITADNIFIDQKMIKYLIRITSFFQSS